MPGCLGHCDRTWRVVYLFFVCYYVPVVMGHCDRTWRVVYIFFALLLCAYIMPIYLIYSMSFVIYTLNTQVYNGVGIFTTDGTL